MIKNLNFILILITIAVLAAIGVIFIFGSGYGWVRSVTIPNWTQTTVYQDYVAGMNLAVAPLAVVLVAILGLCIPKRLFNGTTLLRAMGALLAVSAVFGIILGWRLGIGFLLAAAMAVQVVVIGMTLAGDKRLAYETTGFFVQIGSALLHLGFILFLFDFVNLSGSKLHLDVFWVATGLIGVGMILCFYSAEFSRLGKAAKPAPDGDEQSDSGDDADDDGQLHPV